MTNGNFVKVLKSMISGDNPIINKMFALKIINDQGKPKLLVRTTNDIYELRILALQTNFVVTNEKEIKEIINRSVEDEASRNDFYKILLEAISTIQNQISKKIKKHKEKNNGTKIQQN